MADQVGHLPRGPARMLKAAKWSIQGLAAGRLHGSSFRLDVYLFVLVAPLACWLGVRVFKMEREAAMLIGAGSAICGAAAVMAAEPV